ncbi:hypothetical protein O3G_MSEX010177, partial [Manduca sexta]
MLGSHGYSEILSLDISSTRRRRITEKEGDAPCRRKIYREISDTETRVFRVNAPASILHA